MNKTSIEWTDYTWNPIRARLKSRDDKTKARSGTFCTRISPGCTNCYASVINKRFGNGLEYAVPNLNKVEYFIDERILFEPVSRKKPSRIFVGDMFDLFHEAIDTALIAEVLRVAMKTERHTFQFLTKRAERMHLLVNAAQGHWGRNFGPHMHFGVSVEDNQRAQERIPHLQQTKCAVRFLSIEPQLEEIDFLPHSIDGMPAVNMLTGADWCDPPIPGIDWVICGGESGPAARPFNLAWAESLLKQCRTANLPFFMKQLGSRPIVHSCSNESCTHPDCGLQEVPQKDRKGGDITEWPEALRVREFPRVQVLA